jgi:hypothetical protein
MVEEQALDRVHRLGQTKPVEMYRYFVEDSIEKVRSPVRPSVSPSFSSSKTFIEGGFFALRQLSLTCST